MGVDVKSQAAGGGVSVASAADSRRISRNVLQAFIEHPRIDFAYPRTRFFRNPDEGKSALGGPQRDGPDDT